MFLKNPRNKRIFQSSTAYAVPSLSGNTGGGVSYVRPRAGALEYYSVKEFVRATGELVGCIPVLRWCSSSVAFTSSRKSGLTPGLTVTSELIIFAGPFFMPISSEFGRECYLRPWRGKSM